MSIKTSYTLTISLSAITILSGTVLSSTVFADSNIAQDNVSVNVPVSCTMNGTGMNSHTANIPNGTYESEIGTTTLKSFCNDSQGFAIYAIGYTNEEYGNTTLIGANQGQTIVTGTATTTGNPDISNWAVKLATDSTATYPLTLDNSFGSYSNVPSSYTKVAHRDSGTDLGSSATGAELTTTYAAYISKGQKADTYDGKVKFTLIHPSTTAPNTIKIAQRVSQWGNTLSVGDEVTMMDIRDGKMYTAARLADGNIWMTQNLDFDIDSTKVYTSADTDLPSNNTWRPTKSTRSSGDTGWNSNDAFYAESADPGDLYWSGNITTWDDYYASCTKPGYQDTCDASINPENQTPLQSGNSHYHLGNYYNWTAALAMNDRSSYGIQDNLFIDQSICPAGWALPRGGYGDDTFYSLVNSYSEWVPDGNQGNGTFNNMSIYGSPFYMNASGEWRGNQNVSYSIGGELMSSVLRASSEDGYDVWGISAYGNNVRSAISFYDFSGHPVRCIARPVTTTIVSTP